MLGTLTHRFLDPRTFYSAEAALEQAEQLRGARVVTVQDLPEAMTQKLRVDIFEKLAAAEGVFTRLSCAPETNRACIAGLKRMELSSPLRFPHVNERCFDNVFRRSAFIRMKSTFIDRERYDREIKSAADGSRDGIFAREADLGDFLKSGPGVLAGLIAQHGFECSHTQDRCHRTLRRRGRRRRRHVARGAGSVRPVSRATAMGAPLASTSASGRYVCARRRSWSRRR